jgi:hypothetical protein
MSGELYAVRVRTLGGRQWVASDVLSRGRVVLSFSADQRYPLGATRAEHFSELLRQQAGQGNAVEVVPFYAADQPEPQPEPPKPSRKIMRCVYGKGHRHTSDCPLVEVEVAD